jgi:hypothetical protein
LAFLAAGTHPSFGFPNLPAFTNLIISVASAAIFAACCFFFFSSALRLASSSALRLASSAAFF